MDGQTDRQTLIVFFEDCVYTMIPAPVKVYKLLLNEVGNLLEFRQSQQAELAAQLKLQTGLVNDQDDDVSIRLFSLIGVCLSFCPTINKHEIHVKFIIHYFSKILIKIALKS
jgi:hypothetical protein